MSAAEAYLKLLTLYQAELRRFYLYLHEAQGIDTLDADLSTSLRVDYASQRSEPIPVLKIIVEQTDTRLARDRGFHAINMEDETICPVGSKCGVVSLNTGSPGISIRAHQSGRV